MGMRVLLNVIAFNVGWFACALSAAWHLPWIGTGIVLLLAGVHLQLAVRPLQELKLMGTAALLGLIWDSLLVASGILTFPSGTVMAGMAPYWMLAMWVNFAMILNVSLRWLKGRSLFAGVLGALGGPLAYVGGEKLGAVVFPDPLLALVSLTLGWAVIMPLLVALSMRFDGVGKPALEARYAD